MGRRWSRCVWCVARCSCYASACLCVWLCCFHVLSFPRSCGVLLVHVAVVALSHGTVRLRVCVLLCVPPGVVAASAGGFPHDTAFLCQMPTYLYWLSASNSREAGLCENALLPFIATTQPVVAHERNLRGYATAPYRMMMMMS